MRMLSLPVDACSRVAASGRSPLLRDALAAVIGALGEVGEFQELLERQIISQARERDERASHGRGGSPFPRDGFEVLAPSTVRDRLKALIARLDALVPYLSLAAAAASAVAASSISMGGSGLVNSVGSVWADASSATSDAPSILSASLYNGAVSPTNGGCVALADETSRPASMPQATASHSFSPHGVPSLQPVLVPAGLRPVPICPSLLLATSAALRARGRPRDVIIELFPATVMESKLSASGAGRRALVEVAPRAWVRLVRGPADSGPGSVPSVILTLEAEGEDGRHHEPGEAPYRERLPAANLVDVRWETVHALDAGVAEFDPVLVLCFATRKRADVASASADAEESTTRTADPVRTRTFAIRLLRDRGGQEGVESDNLDSESEEESEDESDDESVEENKDESDGESENKGDRESDLGTDSDVPAVDPARRDASRATSGKSGAVLPNVVHESAAATCAAVDSGTRRSSLASRAVRVVQSKSSSRSADAEESPRASQREDRRLAASTAPSNDLSDEGGFFDASDAMMAPSPSGTALAASGSATTWRGFEGRAVARETRSGRCGAASITAAQRFSSSENLKPDVGQDSPLETPTSPGRPSPGKSDTGFRFEAFYAPIPAVRTSPACPRPPLLPSPKDAPVRALELVRGVALQGPLESTAARVRAMWKSLGELEYALRLGFLEGVEGSAHWLVPDHRLALAFASLGGGVTAGGGAAGLAAGRKRSPPGVESSARFEADSRSAVPPTKEASGQQRDSAQGHAATAVADSWTPRERSRAARRGSTGTKPVRTNASKDDTRRRTAAGVTASEADRRLHTTPLARSKDTTVSSPVFRTPESKTQEDSDGGASSSSILGAQRRDCSPTERTNADQSASTSSSSPSPNSAGMAFRPFQFPSSSAVTTKPASSRSSQTAPRNRATRAANSVAGGRSGSVAGPSCGAGANGAPPGADAAGIAPARSAPLVDAQPPTASARARSSAPKLLSSSGSSQSALHSRMPPGQAHTPSEPTRYRPRTRSVASAERERIAARRNAENALDISADGLASEFDRRLVFDAPPSDRSATRPASRNRKPLGSPVP